ncbi:MAG: [FeFe] hydrogenase H-cluster radical SAM maturase HydE [Candidatus Firestonebacteria bacterium RIFOXYA2_FULL_40_8]|nr:MAG: [FeFe] hydrogenase H-cluster radical SAM maturase HydE [Candidatus Firestonebacteria bacterium RIFOXYA2_FULL_40_8]
MKFPTALAAAKGGAALAVEWLVPLLDANGKDDALLLAAADKKRAETVGDSVHLRGLIEFSNYCRKNCHYCGLRKENNKINRYRLSKEEILETALKAEKLGYKTIVLQSGEDLHFSADAMSKIIKELKNKTKLAVTLSLGERDEETYFAWKKAGADRYLLRIETTDPVIFKKIHPDSDLEYRKNCLYVLKKLGYQLGSGVMVGLPGQDALSLAKDIIWLNNLGVEMIGIGPFLPHKETPLKDEKGGTLAQALRLIAVLRLVFPYSHMPATTAMGTIDPMGREKALQAGANVMMPNITPTAVRPLYEIYPNKICLDESADKCFGCVTARIIGLGRTVGTDYGDVVRQIRNPKLEIRNNKDK